MSKIKEIIAEKAVGWVIELVILGIVGGITIMEVRKTNEQTREMLAAVSDFASQYQGQAGKAVENVLDEVAAINVEGDVNVKDIGAATKDLISDFLKKDESEDK